MRFPELTSNQMSETEAVHQTGRRAAEVVMDSDICHLDMSGLRLDSETRAAVAARVFVAFHDALGAMLPMRFESTWKPPHVVVGPGALPNRVLLPHHDGGSTTRLETPAQVVECPAVRRKAYAGFVVIDPGADADEGLTTFYPLLPVLRHCAPRGATVDDACRQVERNFSNLRKASRMRGFEPRYLTLPRALGARDPALIALDRNEGNDHLTEEELLLIPEWQELRRGCPCGTCQGEVSRIHCHGLFSATGLSWSGFRARFETTVLAKAGDMVLWNNVFLQHGAIGGGHGRSLQHAYLVAAGPGEQYAKWLDQQWVERWLSAPTPSAETTQRKGDR